MSKEREYRGSPKQRDEVKSTALLRNRAHMLFTAGLNICFQHSPKKRTIFWRTLILSALSLLFLLGNVAEAEAKGPVAVSIPDGMNVERFDVKAIATVAKNGHRYLKVKLPKEISFNQVIRKFMLDSERYGVAVPSTSETENFLLIRFLGEEAAPEKLKVSAFTQDPKDLFERRPGTAYVMKIRGIAKAKTVKGKGGGIDEEFFQAASKFMASNPAKGANFVQFAASRLEYISKGSKAPSGATLRSRRSRNGVMTMYIGLTSVEEALQSDRGLLLRDEGSAKRDIALSKIKPPPLPEHPWEEMIKKLAKKPVIEELARRVPDDMLYLHFQDLRRLSQFSSEFDERFSSLMMAAEQSPGVSHHLARYEEQLILEQTGMAKKMGHLVAKNVALVVSDPFFRDGTDVSMLYLEPNMALLSPSLDGFIANARARHSDLTESTYSIGKHSVRLLKTADRSVHQHQLILDDVLIISNSRFAIKRFIDVSEKRTSSLAESGDFRYMRALYPAGAENEDAFIFISDAFVAHAIGPEAKILQSRRLEALADMRAVSNAALLFGWLEGRRPSNAQEMIDVGVLYKSELLHINGDPIAFDNVKGAKSTSWGSPGTMTPLIERKLSKVSEVEKVAYEAFVERYQQNWDGFIDPIAVRLRRLDGGKKVEIDARMLPLIANTDYQDILEFVGSRSYKVMPAGNSVRIIGAINDKWIRDLDKESNKMLKQPSAGVGNWILAGFGEHDEMYDRFAKIARRKGSLDSIFNHTDIFQSSFFFAFEVKNKKYLEEVLKAIQREIGNSYMTYKFSSRPYKGVPIVEFTPTGYPSFIFGRSNNIGQAAIVNNAFIFAPRRAVLEQQIDEVLAGHYPTSLPASAGEAGIDLAEGTAQSGIDIAFPSGESDLRKILMALGEYSAREACLQSTFSHEILKQGLIDLPTDPLEQRQLAMNYLGYEPTCVHGGGYSIAPSGVVSHEFYGSAFVPKDPTSALSSSPLMNTLQRLKNFSAHISIEGKGTEQGLHVQVSWESD